MIIVRIDKTEGEPPVIRVWNTTEQVAIRYNDSVMVVSPEPDAGEWTTELTGTLLIEVPITEASDWQLPTGRSLHQHLTYLGKQEAVTRGLIPPDEATIECFNVSMVGDNFQVHLTYTQE
jgi:hypothetical protein